MYDLESRQYRSYNAMATFLASRAGSKDNELFFSRAKHSSIVCGIEKNYYLKVIAFFIDQNL